MSQYSNGTVAVTNGSAAVVGTGTAWAANVAAGQLFTISGSQVPYVVGSVTDDTHLTLSTNYAGTTQAGLAYSITTSITPNAGLPYMEHRDIDTPTIFKRAMLILDALTAAFPEAALNYKIAPSVGSNALTLALKRRDGADATPDSPVFISFRNSVLATGDFVPRKLQAALSLVISSGSTLGHAASIASPIYIYAIDNAGPVELAASTKYFGDSGIVTTVAEGGGGAADAPDVMYSTTARANVPFRCLGRLVSTQTTAGTWAAAPTEALPGSVPALDRALRDQGLLQTVYVGDLVENAIINGDMDIAQRGTSFAAVAANSYSLDRFFYTKVGAMVHTISQDADVPTFAQAGRLITNSLRLNLTTADTSIAAGDFCLLWQCIEGYNFKRSLAQRPMAFRTWVKATLAGVYCCSFRNVGTDRSYIAEVTIFQANTWEEKIVLVPASPSAGTWNYTNGIGLEVCWSLAVGSTRQTAAGSWASGDFLGSANQVNGVNTGATDFRTTGWEIVPGNVPMRLPPRSIERELLACQRYYRKTFPQAVAPAQNAGVAGALSLQAAVAVANACSLWAAFPVHMRAVPTIVTYNPSAANANWRDTSAAADRTAGTIHACEHGVNVYISGVPVAGNSNAIHVTAEAEL